MATPLTIVRRDEDWAASSSYSATSTQTGYSASNAGTDDPSVPWIANSGTATLTVNLGATREVGLIGLVMTNADDGKTITIAGGITGSPTLTGNRDANGYPVDLVYLVSPAQNLSSVTFAISGNSTNWSIGRVVIGKARTLGRTFHVGAYSPNRMRPQYTDENDFGHTIRYDLGVQRAGIKGKLRLDHETDLATLQDAIDASKYGFYPTFIVPNSNHTSRYPPMWVRFPDRIEFPYGSPRFAEVSLDLIEECKGPVV